ncbi:hypothetical protein GK047_20830 [Paenibacillus sp. SYP-B3998]|uniref:ABM domain-containing protein n=1 Tax=Paenibacillus sp. SYP-B3998 TaxID=2678564 RepID=A0A6G4A1T1_9BACL|nr:hypothetical protein [Paenibacillus sp. SYP-B3998]NEW08446.1 hypothetical protein [Paenibacillus sp. SYP-B3998]
MFKVFVEYAIKPEGRDSYLIYMRELQSREGRLELLEGTDQPGLFVEIWDGVTYEEYEQMKDERLQEASTSVGKASWGQWITGGLGKLHMWHFKQV